MRNYIGTLPKPYLPHEDDVPSSSVISLPASSTALKPLLSREIQIPVLEFLWGRSWDEHALAVVSVLNPDYLLATYGEIKTLGLFGRLVYVFLRDDQIIDCIELSALADMREDLTRVNQNTATTTIIQYLKECGVDSTYEYSQMRKGNP